MELGYGKGLIWLLFDMTGPSLPPFLLEVIMKDGRSFYIHSPNVRDEDRKSMVLNVYDFRAIDPQANKEIIERLDDIPIWTEENEPEALHPLLTIGRLRCDLDDILYCVEWLTRRWTLKDFLEADNEVQKRALGFQLPSDD